MKPLLLFLSLASLAFQTRIADLHGLALQTMSENSSTANQAIAHLRSYGPMGLDALFLVRSNLLEEQNHGAKSDPVKWSRLQHALNEVSQQYDAETSHLFWHTDLDLAKAAARATGKPILSLRLLGNLNENLSCANSRFFRTTLYCNQEISTYLRDHFILHWKSERPVPKVTIDFGDGRKLQSTITGNSIHYVLDPEGNVIDAIPGLHGPEAFQKALSMDKALYQSLRNASPARKKQLLSGFHAQQIQSLLHQWKADLLRARGEPISESSQETVDLVATANELKLLVTQTDDSTWKRIAAFHQNEATLDEGSRRLITSKYPTAAEAAPIALSKMAVESPLLRSIRNLQENIALDTVRNEYLLHTRIHEWLLQSCEWETLNDRIYSELFLTPKSDPWLGLNIQDFTGVDSFLTTKGK